MAVKTLPAYPQIFTTATARAAAIPNPKVGMFTILTAAAVGTDNGLWEYVGPTDGWTRPWNLPWGELAYAEITANQTGIGVGPTDITSLTTGAITLLANRIIEVSMSVVTTQQTAAGNQKIYITDAVPQKRAAAFSVNAVDPASGSRSTFDRRYRFVSAAGSVTFKLQGSVTAGTMSVIGSSGTVSGDPGPSFITMRDLGPGGAPA